MGQAARKVTVKDAITPFFPEEVAVGHQVVRGDVFGLVRGDLAQRDAALIAPPETRYLGSSICTLTEVGGMLRAKSKASMLSANAKVSVISGVTSI